MKFFERYFPGPFLTLRGIRLRVITPHMLGIGSEVRAAGASARAAQPPPKIEPELIPESSVIQTRLFKPEHVQFKAIDMDIDNIQLAENEVIFVSQSFVLNKYILYYNSVYLPVNIDGIIDPTGELNSESFKVIPAWGIGLVYRSNHPDMKEGTSYHGFFPVAPYSVRTIEGVNQSEGTALQNPPDFKGPLEWLRLVRTDTHPEFVADLFEYFKIAITYARLLQDCNFYGAQQLVLSSASSTSAQIIAMCIKQLRPDFPIIGLTSPRNLEMVEGFSYFDKVFTYDDITLMDSTCPSLYFDVLGNESVATSCLNHFSVIKRWWAYGQGGERWLKRLKKINRRGALYTNGIDSLAYAKSNGISDSDILTQAEALNQKYDLERIWGEGYRTISSTREVHELYTSFLQDTHPSGERVRYISPLHRTLTP